MSSDEASVPYTESGTRVPEANQTDQDSPPFVQDSDFWYQDGSIVLVARAEVAFRVHKGILGDHSAIFRDLFAVPQPQGGEQDGRCPIVHLSDAPGEMRCLLRALYHPRRYYMPNQRVSFAMVAALIRLGHKYAIDDLVSSALSRLATSFSGSFEVYYASLTAGGSPDMSYSPEDAIAAVNLARLIGQDADMLLPSALYTCCQLPSNMLTRGIANEDGDVQLLSDADLDRCIDARARLSALALSSMVQRFQLKWDYPSDQGTQKEGRTRCTQAFCAPYLGSAASRVLGGTLGLPRLSGALDSADWFVTDSVRGGLLCRVCADGVKEKDKTERQRIWRMLPTVLGLQMEGWCQSDQCKT